MEIRGAFRSALFSVLMCASSLPGQDLLLTVQKLADSVGFYEADTGKPIAHVHVGVKPHEFNVSSDRRWLFVTMYGLDTYTQTEAGGNTIVVIDLKTRKMVGEVSTGEYRRPHGIERGKSGLFYISTEIPAAVHVFDGGKRRILHSIPITGKQPHMLVVSEDETMAWTADSGSGTVSIVSLTEKKQVGQIQTGGVPMGFALSKDEKRLFLAGRSDNKVTEIDTATRKVVRRLDVPGQPARLLLTPGDTFLLASLIGSGELAVIDPAQWKEVKRVKVGGRCEGMMLSPDGESVYVSAQADNRIHRFHLPDFTLDLTIPTAAKPDPILILPAKAGK
jgi:DNA-binding beta-propeller fold protein YncE